jgi:RES domain-containing protein
MIVYRLARTKYAEDLSGEGARLHGGRWNHTGVPCIYTAASRALALLEYTVNTNIDDIPRALSMVSIKIPDDDIQVIPMAGLPGNWTVKPIPDDTRNFGTALLSSPQHLIIQIPSVVIPEEFNYILNPLHPRAGELRIDEISDFVYDERIKTAP